MFRVGFNEEIEGEAGIIPAFVPGQVLDYDVGVFHNDYVLMAAVWAKCRDGYSGGVSVKSKEEEYLPKLNESQTDKDYIDYLNRSYWYGATGKTVDVFVGMIFRKDPTMNFEPESKDLQERFKKITSDGQTTETLARKVVKELFIVNRIGILEDYPITVFEDGFVLQVTQLEADQADLKSNTVLYDAEKIINWKDEEVDGKKKPVFFVLSETREVDDSESPFSPGIESIFRILYLEEQVDLSVVYKQAVIVEAETVGSASEAATKEYVVESVVMPLKNGVPLDSIPFWIRTMDGADCEEVKTPTIYDMVELNFAHYRNSADYEREIHRVAIKTAVFPGWDTEEYGDPELGGALASPPNETPFILEAKSTSPLKEVMKSKEEQMAVIGAQMLAQRGRYVQSAETATITSRGESSIVATAAKIVGEVFSEVLTFKAEWSSQADIKVTYELNTDFDEASFNANDLKTLFELLQGGGISYSVFYNAMDKNEMYPIDWSEEKEKLAIEETKEAMGMTSNEFDEVMGLVMSLESQVSKKTEKEEEIEEPLKKKEEKTIVKSKESAARNK